MLHTNSFKILFLLLFLPSFVLNFCKQTYIKTSLQIKTMAVSPSGRYIAAAHSDNTVRFYHGDNYMQIGKYTLGFAVNVLRFSGDGYYLAIGGANSNVHLLNAYQPFGLNKTFDPLVGNPIMGLDFSNDSSKFVACGGTGSGSFNYLNVVHNAAWTNIFATVFTPVQPGGFPTDCRISPFDGKLSVTNSRRVTFFTSAGASPATYAPGSTTFSRTAFDPLANFFIYIDTDGDQFFNMSVATGIPQLIQNGVGNLNSVDFALNGKYISTGGDSKVLYIFDYTRINMQRWSTAGQIRGVVFNRHPINQKLFVGDSTGQILVLTFNCSFTCPPDYYIDPTGCKFCGDSNPKCISCSNQTICDKCVDGYYVQPNNYTCQPCTMLGCLTCSDANNCTQCHSGFYNTTSGGVTICKRCSQSTTLEGCAICNSSTICIACNNDYYLDTTNKVCKLCSTISNCLKCNNGTVCTECHVGFFKNGNTCSPCSANCLSCEGANTNCTQCGKGWYLDMPTSYTCTRCRTGCLACNNSNFCQQCQNGMYQKIDGTCAFCVFPCINCIDDTICNNCASGYHISGTSCVACTNNCATCNSTTCNSCLAGFYMDTGDVCKACVLKYKFCEYCTPTACESCQNGYFLNTSTLCQHCSEKMFKCEKCSSGTDCLSCIEGFYHTGSIGNASCKSCEVGCQTCINSGDCRKCYKQYYLDANSDCIACSGNCLQCTDTSICQVCDEGYYLDGAVCKLCKANLTNCLSCSSGTVCIDCDIGYYLDSSDSKCKRCTNNCTTCTSSKCLSCVVGYYLTTTASPTCELCSQICSQCTSPTVCTSCKSGHYLDSSTWTCKNCTLNRFCRTCNDVNCYSCIYGYYLDNTISPPNFKCSRCLSKIQGCVHCNATNYCFSCDYGYFRDPTTNLCVSCTAINGCEKCSNFTTCQSCIPGYYLNTSNKCQQCKTGCSTCDSSGNCYICSAGFYLNSVNCLPCKDNIQGCALCNTSNLCVQCMNSYYLVSGTSTCNLCRNPLAGCLYCNDSSTCTNCQPGFYIDTTTHKCETCDNNMAGCEICSASNICLDCQTGYYLASGGTGCTPCSSTLIGCLSCADINTCRICKTGFYLHTNNKCQTCFSINSGCHACAPDGIGGIICYQCSTGFYLNSVSNLCSSCGNIGCEICDQTNPSICITCDSTYYKSGTSCIKCSSSLAGCNQCSSSSACISCDIGYYLDSTGKCKLCQDVLGGCSKCQINGGNYECLNCKSSYILNSVTKNCQSCFSVLQGCTYCVDSSQCIACSNGYFKDSTTKLCRSCTQQQGCMLCSNETSCQYCGPSYYIDHSIQKCIKCSTAIQFCLTCLESTRCLSCQSGYIVNQKFQCEQVTVSGKQKINGLKLITEYIDKQTLSHTLYVQTGEYSNIGYDLNGACNLFLTDYSALATTKKISQVQLVIKNVRWLSPIKIMFQTNNPTSPSVQQMGLIRRLQSNNELQNPNRNRILQASNMGNFKVSLQMTQQAFNTILPNFYQTGDLVLDYSLDEPQFYMSYLKYQSKNTDSVYYSLFGYIITGIIIANFMYKTYKLASAQNMHHHTGQILSHIFALKSISLFYYPVTYEFYYFCYGFMLTDLPWLNYQIGSVFGERSDYVPTQMVMYFYNLNIASTHLLALVVFIILICLRFTISKNKQLARSKYTQLIYCIFMFGLVFAGSLSLQGAVFNPLTKISLNAVFYLIGILVYLILMLQMLYSIYINKENLYKIRIFIKATLLSLGHLNPIIVVSVSIITDIILIVLQYIIIESNVGWGRFWLANNILLDLCLAAMFLMPNSAISLYATIFIVGVVAFIQILLNLKLNSYYQQKSKQQNKTRRQEYPSDGRKSKAKSSYKFNQTQQTFINQKQLYQNDQSINLFNPDFVQNVDTLHNIAIQDQRVQNIKKRFNQQSKQSRYISFVHNNVHQQNNLQNNMSFEEPFMQRKQNQNRRAKRRSNNKIQEQGHVYNNPFRIQNSSSSSPTEEQSISIQQKQKKKAQSRFLQSIKAPSKRGRKLAPLQ